MDKNKKLYQNLAQAAGWLSLILFVLGAIAAWTDQDILVSGNDHWQGALYLALFAIYARMSAKE